MNERGDDNVKNCVKRPNFSIAIKQVHRYMRPNCVISRSNALGEIVHADIVDDRVQNS